MARGSVVKRPSGRYGIRYYAYGRRYYETIGPDEKAAERALTARLHELDTGTWREPSEETLEQFGKRWIERRRTRLAPSTVRGYEGYLERHVYKALGHRPLLSLRPADFDDLVGKLEAGGMPAGSVRNAIVPVRAILSDAVRQGLLPSNPAARVDLPPPPGSAGREIPPEHQAAIRTALVELAPPDPLRGGEPDLFWAWFVDVALGTGMRESELLGLRWQACDFVARSIRVDRAIVLGQEKRPKSGHARAVPMFESVQKALQGLAARALERERYGAVELVFATMRGTPFNPANVNHRIWRPALKKAAKAVGQAIAEGAKLEPWPEVDYRLHDCRHTCVSRLVAAGADIAVVQAVAGHASAATTLKVYTHLRDARLKQAADLFDPADLAETRALDGH